MAPIHVDVVIAAPDPEPAETVDTAAPEDSAPIDGAADDATSAAPNQTRGKREKEEDQ